MERIYDIIILGAGPAGLTSGLYAGRNCRSTLIIEKSQEGGQIAATAEIENYPGQMPEDSGLSLAERMMAQAERFGCERRYDEILEVELDGEVKRLTGIRGKYLAKSVIIAAGAHPTPIGCENEERFVGRGISFCATCDGALFADLEVYVVGGGDSAVEEAIYLAKYARRVTIIHRRAELRAAKSIQAKAFAHPKIDVLWNSVVVKVDGEEVLDTIEVKNTVTGEISVIKASPEDGMLGLFGFVGYCPNTELFAGKLPMNEGYIVTDENMYTGIPGVYAAGDIRAKCLRQVITAASDGATAAMQAERYLSLVGELSKD